MLKKVQLHPGGSSFEDSPHFSQGSKDLLVQHYSRLQGTLGFWKNEAEKYKKFHYYCLLWTIPMSILTPIIIQFIDGSFYSKLFITITTTHMALLLAIHKGFKVESNFKAFRLGESEYYDLCRKFLDRPKSFGETEEEQLEAYFRQVETIRKFVRNAETDNIPTFENSTSLNN